MKFYIYKPPGTWYTKHEYAGDWDGPFHPCVQGPVVSRPLIGKKLYSHN